MGLKELFKNWLKGNKDSNIIDFYLQDGKCGEKIKVLLRKSYDIQRVYADSEEAAFMIKKVIICNKCYNKIIIDVKFDKNYNVISQQIQGGRFITEEEFNPIDQQ